ncbi:hypothetical protein PG996_007692 [Apiospora saccharicola]|uniref:Uncharacterized protein n=1 Tax=Apiospora saccharicola TaxID=335842 RepID=A0ABR1VBK9_9PEZI
MSPHNTVPTSSNQDNVARDIGPHGAVKLNSGSSKQGKHRGGHAKDNGAILDPPSSSNKPSKKSKPKRLPIPHLSSPGGTHASPTMASGSSFTPYQALPYGHVDNGVAYTSSHHAYGPVSQAGDDPAAADACLPMDRWFNESRQDEPFHAFNLDNSSYSNDAAVQDSYPMSRWLDQTRQDEPFSVFSMANGSYADNAAAEADFDPMWTGCADGEEGDI